MMPPTPVTQRLLTPVTPTNPTFCENDVYGNVLKIPPDQRAETVRQQSSG